MLPSCSGQSAAGKACLHPSIQPQGIAQLTNPVIKPVVVTGAPVMKEALSSALS